MGSTFSTRIVSVVLAAVLLAGCGATVEENIPLSDEVTVLLDEQAADRLFVELTDWDWDEVYVFDLANFPSDKVNEIVGHQVAATWSTGGALLVYHSERKVVRVDQVTIGGLCTGIYTKSAVVTSRYACWLHDENARDIEI